VRRSRCLVTLAASLPRRSRHHRGYDGLEIEIFGYLAELMDEKTFPERSRVGGTLVAEEGFEPPTYGL
jgi:hypothetical protein